MTNLNIRIRDVIAQLLTLKNYYDMNNNRLAALEPKNAHLHKSQQPARLQNENQKKEIKWAHEREIEWEDFFWGWCGIGDEAVNGWCAHIKIWAPHHKKNVDK